MRTTPAQKLVRLARRHGVVRARQAVRAGIHSEQLTRLVAAAVLERIGRGRYQLVDRKITEHHGLVVASRAVPRGVICLLSALNFHDIGTQLPHEVWIAVPRGTRTPAPIQPPLRVFHVSGKAFTTGIETHRVEGQRIRVYSVAKTLADLFKFRNRVGLEVALEALREAWRDRKVAIGDLMDAARICRVERVMRPYVEALVA
jgi:predicted transcriptional regulator of viral defense system